MPLDPEFLEILRCPESRAVLVEDGGLLVSTDRKTRRAYRIEDGDLPVLVVEESKVLDERTWLEVMKRHGLESGS